MVRLSASAVVMGGQERWEAVLVVRWFTDSYTGTSVKGRDGDRHSDRD